jgi:hypothetical protein
MSPSSRWAMVVMAGGLAACGGDKDATSHGPPAAVVEVISPALLAKTWPVRLADNAQRAPFEADQGWQHLFQREYPVALKAFSRSKNGEGIARVHLEYALIYRQAARLGANATIQAYDTDRQATDPDEMEFVIAVSQALLGHTADARTRLSRMAKDSTIAPRVLAWSQLLEANGALPTDLDGTAAMIGGLPPVVVGTLPTAPSIPHFRFAEKTAQARPLGANDPTAMWGIAQWHDAAVLEAAPSMDPAVLAGLRSRWSLPGEPKGPSEMPEIADTWLFARTLLSTEDVGFVMDLRSRGPDALADWREKSPLAAAIGPAWDGQKVDPQIVMDQSLGLMRQTTAAMVEATGSEAGFHRPFALFARLGVLAAGQELADVADQYRDAGILRLEALERMAGGAGGVERDPVFAMSMAAWDAGNRNPLRPEDIVHDLVPEFPGIEAVRAPLDALHLRRSRNAAPSSPVH